MKILLGDFNAKMGGGEYFQTDMTVYIRAVMIMVLQ